MKFNKKLAALAITGTIGLSLAACGTTTTVTKTAPSTTAPPAAPAPPAPTVTDPSGNTCGTLDAAGYCPGDDPATTPPSATTTGPVDTTFTMTTTDDSGNPVSYDVTLNQVENPSTLTSYESLDTSGDYMVGTEFTIKGDTGAASDDVNSDATIVGSNHQDYTASFNDITAGTNFNSGDWAVSPGETSVGWASFELPGGVTPTSVQWGSTGGTPATWTIGK